jgi:hypothetical protein
MSTPRRLSAQLIWRWGRWFGLIVILAAGVLAFTNSRQAQRESSYCTSSCHTSDKHPEPWRAAGGHESVACQSCHRTTAGMTFKLAATRVTGGKPPAHGAIDVRSCSSCHDPSTERWRRVADTSGHREHARSDKVDCLSCHKQSTHGPQKADATCKDCHATDRLHHGVPDSETCTTCHNYSVDDSAKERLTLIACTSCHGDAHKLALSAGDKPVRPSMLVTDQMLHGGVDCKLCHQPHRALPKESKQATNGDKPKPGVVPAALKPKPGNDAKAEPEQIVAGGQVCRQCHQIQIGTFGAPVPEGHTNCIKCHGAHAPIEQFVVPCKECHKEGREVERGPRSTALHHESCASCHVPHSWKAPRSGCVQCHEEKATLVQAKSPPEHQDCTNCHAPHEPLPKGQVCVSCHKNKGGHLALAPAKHKNCASCHDPHTANVRPLASCAGCHAGQNRQLVSDGPAAHEKKGCLGCHQPHSSPSTKAGLCASCHTKLGPLVAKAGPEPHRKCASCHKPHRFTIANPTQACSGCHKAIVASPGPHDGACNKCHSQHGSPLVSKAACEKCHQQIQLKPPPGNVQHATCSSCHQPHKDASAAPQLCATCHRGQATIAKAWPAQSAHAGKCNECHQPHAVRDVKTCASCHAKQASSASGGKHQCRQCHAPHQTPPGVGKAWWQRCASCHTSQTKQAKAGQVHADCSNCHKPHKFTAPKCNSCHAAATAKAGHATKGHDNCADCHSTHQATLPGRAQCMSCHKNMTQHHPTAQRCQACHPFK